MRIRKLVTWWAVLSVAVLSPFSARAQLDVLPGTCGWTVRSDPISVNVLYPDEDAVYYIAALPLPPPGALYRVTGEFPHARYLSFVTYNGLPVDSLLDSAIVPDHGSTNPFVAGADRTAAQRSYTVTVGGIDPGGPRPANTLYLSPGQHGSPTAVGYLYYRIYVPDAGTAPRAGVALPRITLVLPAGEGSQDAAVIDCEGVRDAGPDLSGVQRSVAEAPTTATPVSYLRATAQPSWEVQSGLTAAVLGRVGQGDLVKGGPGSNPHNNYIVAPISRSLGEVLVVRAKAPGVPETRAGQPVMGTGDLRYWSWCQNSRTTRYVDCLSDEDMTLGADGWLTIVVSDPAHRPRNAANWIAWGPEPDGQLIYRHMLPSEAFFPHSAQGVAAGTNSIDVAMGDYYPRGTYCSTAQFEEDRCGNS